MIAQLVRFRSGLSDDDVEATFEARLPQYRTVPGLRQKIYLRFPNGEYGAVYLWSGRGSLEGFRQTDLARTIPTAYEVEGYPEVEIADVVLVLRPEAVEAGR
jgi:hypothetical protein